MTSDNPPGEKESKPFWNTAMGTITIITALLITITVLLLTVKPYLKTKGKREASVLKYENQGPAINYYSIATDMAHQWYNDLKNKNFDGLVSISSVPFNAGNKILNSLPEVRASYKGIADKFNTRKTHDSSVMNTSNVPVLFELKIYKASELKSKGFDLTHGRFFNGLNLENDPYVGLLEFNGNGNKDYIELVYRKVGNTLKIAGWWD